MKQTYAAAGVNIKAATDLKKVIGKLASATCGPEVVSGVGFFGGLYEFKGYRNPVLVSSVDGVGTKLRIAIALDKHDTIGMDIVNHCVNDIFTSGASPLFFLDYIATGKLEPGRVEQVVKGLVSACKDVGCALIGGETAEMPGIYSGEDYDLAGFIVGVVEENAIKMGRDIIAGDAIIGLPSSGLHTNGYSLVRKVFGETAAHLNKRYRALGRTLGEALLEPHRCYYNQVRPFLPKLKALAHITGGSFYKNVPRILPAGLAARLDSRTWTAPPIFELIQKTGNIDRDEMFHVFNMGIGMALVCSPDKIKTLTKALPEAMLIGEVVKQSGRESVIIE